MTKVTVLITGYARKSKGLWHATAGTTLIEAEEKKIIVDPGCNKELLLNELNKREISTEDIGFVFLTHGHTDHIILTALFENAKVVNYVEVYDGEVQYDHNGKIPGTDINIVHTPGHDIFHGSLIVKASDQIYAIVGDLFWWMDGEQTDLSKETLMSLKDPYMYDEELLRKSRNEILKIADYIVPGHGRIFKVDR